MQAASELGVELVVTLNDLALYEIRQERISNFSKLTMEETTPFRWDWADDRRTAAPFGLD